MQAGGDEIRRALNVRDVLRQRADAGDAEEVLQLREETILVGFDERVSGERHTSL
jgi:hypothetical protein